MCLLVLAWRSHPRYPLVVAANRDEFHARPAAALAWWRDLPQVLAGRDLRAQGTWLGTSRTGRFAAVTNFREPAQAPPADQPSRGSLAVDFLASSAGPNLKLREIEARASRYAGFNILAGGREGLHYFSNRSGQPVRELDAGIYGLSNHLLDVPWPKLVRTRTALSRLLASQDPQPDALFDLMDDREPTTDAPTDGGTLPPDLQRALSAPFVVHDAYGTRCSTVLLMRSDGRVELRERTFDPAGRAVAEAGDEYMADAA